MKLRIDKSHKIIEVRKKSGELLTGEDDSMAGEREEEEKKKILRVILYR
jgi:hypothetical protein